MNKVIVCLMAVFLSACSAVNQQNNSQMHVVYNSDNTIDSVHTSEERCEGKAIRENIRREADWNVTNKPHERTRIGDQRLVVATCR
ncbi:hypothetical protein [Thalassotalea sp. PS06]|uniref:hypothetical protein n=1 Tax=Thalassotalea sp. PS06 TaxID=2594005 RepID=UPI0011637C5C|nr:hypothetical protein [Thalassotalea sp. PS06]QDP02642.1 hypothetical protein FNC98_15580 [Thalassotalea sp. PS06]